MFCSIMIKKHGGIKAKSYGNVKARVEESADNRKHKLAKVRSGRVENKRKIKAANE